MKKSNRSIHLSGIPGFSLVLAFLAAMFLISCNGGNKDKSKEDSLNEADVLYDQTWVMKLSADSLRDIFGTGGGNTVKSLKFTWVTKKKRYALVVAGESEKGKQETKDYILDIISTEDPIKNPKGLKRNPQMITRGDMKRFLSLATGTPNTIPANDFKDMYFIAHQSEDPNQPGKMLMYLAYSDNLQQLIKTLAGSGDTKPSPPAPPCDTQCDD